jgi:5-methylthioadenosine/S-adenosylhomocysteine deaminase
MGDPDNSGSDRAAADILVLGGIVVTMDERRTILPDGALALRGDSILALGPRAQIAAAYRGATIVDATGCLVIPGLIDAHTHIPMTLFRGLADDLPLHTWLEQHVWPAEHRFINPETVRWASRLGVAELLRSGVTTLCDMYFYEDEVAAVVDELGMRGVLANAHFDVTTATNTDRERTLAEAEQFVTRWRGHSRIVPALGPHAPYTVGLSFTAACTRSRSGSTLLLSRTWPRLRKKIATSAVATVARRSATWRTSVSSTAGWSPPTVSGSTARRSTC